MGKATVIPFGPQHPVLPEPLHLDLVVEDETVLEAIPQIGFIHRGLEKLVETRDLNQFIYVAERICGICAFGHSMGYAETVEKLMGVEVAASRRVPARHLARAVPHPLPRAVDGPGRRRVRLREPVHALLAPARARARHLREDHRRPRHLLGGEGGRRRARHRRRHCMAEIEARAGRHARTTTGQICDAFLKDALRARTAPWAWAYISPRTRSPRAWWAPSPARSNVNIRRAHAWATAATANLPTSSPCSTPRATATPACKVRVAGGAASPSTSSRR